MKIILIGDESNEQEKVISALKSVGLHSIQIYQDEKQLLTDACSECDVATRRGELVQQVIVNIANAVGFAKDLNDLYRVINEELNRLIDATNLFIGIYDPVNDQFQLPLQHDQLEESISVIPAGKTLSRYLFTTNQPLLLKYEDIERMAAEGLIERKGVPAQTWMGVPLRSESSIIGVLVVQNYENKDAFTIEDLELLKFVSNQIRISIERKKSELELIEAKEKAIQSDKLKTSFLTNMSHEVRTPMNAIIGFSTLLDDPDISREESAEYVSLISSNASILLNIIDNVIEVAMLESGEVVLDRKQFGVNQLFVDLLDEFEKSEDRHPDVSINICAAGSDEEYMLYNDSNRLMQLLKILIGNALKFTEKGSVEFGYKLIEDKYIEFIVKDTGVGIPASQQVNVFERFRQADDSLTRKFGGTGLGLTIVKHLVDLMEGQIMLESEEGKGSLFRILLPLVQPTPETLPGIPPKRKAGLDLSGKHILVVEDVESNYQYLVAVLKSTKVNIHWITDGNAAVDFCQNYSDVDMIFMDINLPGIDGYEATRLIKAVKPDLPIIALTAYAMSGEKERSLEAGCDEYLSKPVSPRDLLNVVNRFLI
ncbi:MAG: ATP-binding protein [Bacteroidota bacterium]|nr:ATP-binding protein [Bacteroidota bacterium]